MAKRSSTNSISDFEESGKKLIKDVNSEVVKVQTNGAPQKSELSYFIKDERMVHVLNDKGIKGFFPIQYETFEHIYKGNDVIARDRTGSGKTLAFSLPIIQRFRKEKAFNGKVKFLIVLPTRQLTIQVKGEINSLKFKHHEDFSVVAVYGGSDIYEQMRKIRDGCDIIVSTPGRLIDLLERGAFKLSHLQVTCLDQADEMLKQGFQEDIEKIFEFVKKHAPNKTQNLLFSATIPSWVVQLSRKYLSPDRTLVDLIKDSDIRTSKTVQHFCLNCPYYFRNAIISDIVNMYGGRYGRTIIFCETKREANEILLKANLKQETQVLHGDIPQKQREVTFQSFKEGKLKCLVATNVAARGLDIPEVDLIVQLEPPKQVDAYIHRSGRTGRAGKSGYCVTFYQKKQQGLIDRIERMAKIKLKRVGPPQPIDIIKSSARDIVLSLKEVNDTVLMNFKDIAEEMITQDGAVRALSKALAFISGNTKKISQRSLISATQGFITYLLKFPHEYDSSRMVFSFMKNGASDKLSYAIRDLKRVNKTTAAFDLPQDFRAEVDQLIEDIKNGKHKGHELDMVTTMEQLEDEDERHECDGDEEEVDERIMREALRNKRDWEVFIGSLPSNADERELTSYFKSKKVKITNIRVLRNDKGESKCVAFGLCLDDDSLRRAVKLDGETFGSKTLRINRAAKR